MRVNVSMGLGDVQPDAPRHKDCGDQQRGGQRLTLQSHGNCRAARPALPGDLESATFCLSAPAAVWLRLTSGALEPGVALMGGGLKLTRGSLFSLLPHLKAAQALLHCARLVPTHLPASGI